MLRNCLQINFIFLHKRALTPSEFNSKQLELTKFLLSLRQSYLKYKLAMRLSMNAREKYILIKLKEGIDYNIMFDFFAESEYSYLHLEEYQQLCYERERDELQRKRAEALQAVSFPKQCQRQPSSLQFEPIQIHFSECPQTDYQQYVDNPSTLVSSCDFEQFSQFSNTNGNDGGSQQIIAEPARSQRDKRNEQNILNVKNKTSFNTIDYIIKHCLKKMLSHQLRDQVEPICEQENLTYPQFCQYWTGKLENFPSNKHIGLTRFKKMIDDTRAKAVVVLRQFLTLYLWQEYPRYVANVGQMHNKQEYLRCATKLMYISSMPLKGSDIIQWARKR